MAYAALVSLSQTLELILNHRKDPISPQVKDQFLSINEHVIFLQVFLEEFPNKASSLEAKIREVIHVAEDVIEYMSERFHDSSVAPSKSVLKHHPKGELRENELKRVAQEIEAIAEKASEIKNTAVQNVQLGGHSMDAGSSSRVAIVSSDSMVGFDNFLMEMKSRLCGESSKLEVVPIVGMGGIGKTTLARNANDNPLIKDHFDIRVWVTISQTYSVQEIVSSLLVSMKVFGSPNDSIGEHKVHKNLKGRRYLIVLDDIWSTKAWDDLRMMFPDDGNGSRVMLTTRLFDVASYANSSSHVHEMRLMEEDQSWNLLRQKVFKQDPCPNELDYLGKMIAKSCRGLPLAIAVISGLLAVDQTKAAWEKVARDVKSAISTSDDQFDSILSLSYAHLPHHLRPCYLYMGVFPEDHEICLSKLIKLWIAEGFLKPKGCGKSFEETGEEYFEDLVKRSLVLVTARKSNGRVKGFKMHDLMREMCIKIAQEDNFSLHVHKLLRRGKKIPRRVRVSCSGLDILDNVYGLTIRTMIHLEHRAQGTGCSLGHFRLLRILDVSNAYEFFFYSYEGFIASLPDQIFELIHLRYLAFDFPFSIPAAISNLRNLQTLVICSNKLDKYLRCNSDFILLPREIWEMPQLRHLVSCFEIVPFEEGAMSALDNINTFSLAKNFVLSKKILEMIPNVKRLGLCYTTDDNEDYQLNNLEHLQWLENLKLMTRRSFCSRKQVSPAFPRTLKKLTLSGPILSWEDMNLVSLLPNLEVLKLRDHACDGYTWETTDGEFCQLKFLQIHRSNLWHWITDASHFPRLNCLVLSCCWYLSEIPDEIGEIPTLELIEVEGSISLVDSAKRIQEDQKSCGNDALKVRII